jgi:hypothetical protein
MDKSEDRQLNHPVRKYFEKKLKCAVARNEFSFSAGKLDVLAYDRANKCFHICEGKRSSNVASVGHAIGQLIAYISMIQEGGYDFLNRISKEERLELSDFTVFMENRSIDICFYVALPFEKQEKLLNAAQLMLNNMGDFGGSIGIFFASNKKCILAVPAKPLSIKIRRIFDNNDFLAEIKRKFLAAPESKGIVVNPTQWAHLLQFKEKDGNPFLHYEVWLRQRGVSEASRAIEVAFHLEFAKAHLADATTRARKKKLQNTMSRIARELRRQGLEYKYEAKWGKQWSRIYTLHKINQTVLDDTVLDDVLLKLKALTSVSKPLFDKINWGRIRGAASE